MSYRDDQPDPIMDELASIELELRTVRMAHAIVGLRFGRITARLYELEQQRAAALAQYAEMAVRRGVLV